MDDGVSGSPLWRVTLDSYRKCSGGHDLNGASQAEPGALSIRALEVSRWRGVLDACTYGFRMVFVRGILGEEHKVYVRRVQDDRPRAAATERNTAWMG